MDKRINESGIPLLNHPAPGERGRMDKNESIKGWTR